MACALFQERVARRTPGARARNINPAFPPARCVDSFPRCLRELLRCRGLNTPLVLSKALHHLAGTPRVVRRFETTRFGFPTGNVALTLASASGVEFSVKHGSRCFRCDSHGWCWPVAMVPSKGTIRIRASAGARDALTKYLAF